MSRTRALILSAVIATGGASGLMAAAAVQENAGAQAPARGAPDANRGEQILSKSCQGCHDLRPVQVQAMDAAGWTKTIDTMLVNGAEVAKDDIPVLLQYLVINHGPVPDGPGKTILLNTCTMCHDLQRIKLGRRSGEDWEETLGSMLNEGAPLSEADFPIIHEYLAKNFGVD